MRRFWPIFTAVLCVLLIAVSFVASGRSGKTIAIAERDGIRVVNRRVMGFIPLSRTEPDPSLHVSNDLRKQVARIGLKLSPELAAPDARATRSRQPGLLQDMYDLSGETSATPKDAIDFYARQMKGLRRYKIGHSDQLSGACPDGTILSVVADDGSGRTYVSLSLVVRR